MAYFTGVIHRTQVEAARKAGLVAFSDGREAAFDDVAEAPVRPMLDALTFIRNKRHGGMAFRNGKFKIGAKDYEGITTAMLGGAA